MLYEVITVGDGGNTCAKSEEGDTNVEGCLAGSESADYYSHKTKQRT